LCGYVRTASGMDDGAGERTRTSYLLITNPMP
jgi:hypothetical protein